jgi:hypothetical protein
MAVCCQNLMLGALSSCSALSVLVGVLFKKFGLFLNASRMNFYNYYQHSMAILILWNEQFLDMDASYKCSKELWTPDTG